MEITYIMDTDNYTYEPYTDRGFSGKILLAKPKTDGLEMLLIKSENPSSACCEFMYSRLAELLRIPAPKAYIMNVSRKDKRLFGSPYVVGIEYMTAICVHLLKVAFDVPNSETTDFGMGVIENEVDELFLEIQQLGEHFFTMIGILAASGDLGGDLIDTADIGLSHV